jgi:hypothetical protein
VASDLEIGPLGAAREEAQLVLHVRDDGRLDGHKQVALVAGILEDDSERVVNVAVDTAIGAEEARHRGGGTKEVQGLVDGVGALVWQPISRGLIEERNWELT